MAQDVIFQGFHITELVFTNKKENGSQVELENRMNYNVNYANNNACRCEFTLTAQDKLDPTNFNLKITLVGFFTFKPGMEKEIIHVKTYKELYPFVRSAVATITTASGIPPIFIPFIDIEGQEIYKFDGGAKPQ